MRILRSGLFETKRDNIGFCRELLYAKKIVKDIRVAVTKAMIIVRLWRRIWTGVEA